MLSDIPTTIPRDEQMPLVEQVREITFDYAGDDEMLDFVPAALALGCSHSKADAMDETLSERVMRAGGAI